MFSVVLKMQKNAENVQQFCQIQIGLRGNLKKRLSVGKSTKSRQQFAV